MKQSLILGIETSCDETAAAVVARTGPAKGRIVSNIVRSQWDDHRAYGGVVPEIAARAHVACLDEIIREAMQAAGLTFPELDAIAVTAGPGLIGGLLVGVTTAKAIAMAHGLPLFGVNHLEAHALTVGLTNGLAPPYLLLLVSGGHSQLLLVNGLSDYERLATTIDDALGEAFDKVAKMLGLPIPGGPNVELMAQRGDATRFALPRPMRGRTSPHFSFAGLKTAVRRQAEQLAPLCDQDIADLAASFQAAVCDCVEDRIANVLAMLATRDASASTTHALRHFVVAGGVASNRVLRGRLEKVTANHGLELSVPPVTLCTDNAAMVAWAGAEQLARTPSTTDSSTDTVTPRARWPLDRNATPIVGAGRLGAKA